MNIKIRVCQIIGPAAAGSAGPVPTALEDRDGCARVVEHAVHGGLPCAQMKTIQAEGLIICAWPGASLIGRGTDASTVGRILFAVELYAGQLRYVFDDARVTSAESTSRPLLLRAGDGLSLNDNRWHDIAIVIVPAAAGHDRYQNVFVFLNECLKTVFMFFIVIYFYARQHVMLSASLLRQSFPGVPTSMTLNDLEPPKYGF